MELNVYLAGQIHDDWRENVKNKAMAKELPVRFFEPMTNHDRSDNIGEEILGEQPNAVFKDEAASAFNNLRTNVLMQKADIVLALFGDQYKQWNAAMDVGAATALNKPLILVRPESLHHPAKEMAKQAQVVVEDLDQAIEALAYIFQKN
ncbi:YtoQ family protein [Natribacillus halophilus]|uniref:YtoQ family protein n=1 Tax=Natribacillus halophilus TaxID=549003 RepID=A0A1G8NFV6_9BACI|nr:YtoQ family protein [Natribacillus halophilus]SDI79151.1 YtoQ family protein [Natribacillus halophilus]